MAIDRAWQNLRERQAKVGTKEVFDELPVCTKCNDRGYWTIIYPNGYDAIHLCDCEKAHKRWGADCYTEMNSRPEDVWWQDMAFYFGGKNRAETKAIMEQYELREKSRKHPKAERVFEYKKKGEA